MSSARAGKSSAKTKEEKEGAALDTTYQKWINQQMEKRSAEYSDINSLKLCCITWNVNTRTLNESCDLSVLLQHERHSHCDIYIIALQEICDLNVMNVIMNSANSDEMSVYWNKQYSQALGNKYTCIFEKHVVGLQLLIYVHSNVQAHIHDIRSCVIYTGSYGVTGNKGGISARFDVFDSPICVVASHFHANRDNVLTRNQDFQTILDTASFLPINSSSGKEGASGTSSATNSLTYRHHRLDQVLSILQHDYVFWLGDLNYRIAVDVEEEDIWKLVNQGDWLTLRAQDQLNIERERGNVFAQFNEGVINFPPSYKFQPGTDVYEQRPEKKQRAPAWCDRILYYCNNTSAGTRSNLSTATAVPAPAESENLQLLTYQSGKLNISDHKPVIGWFNMGCKQYVPERIRQVYQDLLFCVDKWVNASTPKLAVENRIHDFGVIQLDQKYFGYVTLRNTGTVMAEWSFVPKPDELCVSQPFIKFLPQEGILAPGESSTVMVQLFVSTEMAMNQLTSDQLKSLEDICILRLTNGSDFFVVVSASLDPANIEQVRQSYRKVVVSNPIAGGTSRSGSVASTSATAGGTSRSGSVASTTGTDNRESSRISRGFSFRKKESIRNVSTESRDSDDEDADKGDDLDMADIYK